MSCSFQGNWKDVETRRHFGNWGIVLSRIVKKTFPAFKIFILSFQTRKSLKILERFALKFGREHFLFNS